MNNNLNIDIFGWLCIFIAGLGFIFPFSVIGAANLIFISLGITYICYFVWREAQIQADPPDLKEARKNWLYADKIREIEEKKFHHQSNVNCYIVTSTTGITFNASKRELVIPWSEVIQVRSVRVLRQELHTIYTLKNKHHFDQAYKDHLELVEIIKKQI